MTETLIALAAGLALIAMAQGAAADDGIPTVLMRGNPTPLSGPLPKIGEPAPDAVLVGNDMKPVKISDFRGKILVVSAVPSLDTPTCDLETRTFNQKAPALGADVVVLTVSMDLPFAQKRWCGAKGIDKVVTASDHRDGAFGKSWGVMIPELRLHARAVFVVDRAGVLRYTQLVADVSKEPDYDAVLAAVKALP